jgi:glycogen synthase
VSLLDFAQNLKSGFRFFYRNTDKQIMASATITKKKLYRQNHETMEKREKNRAMELDIRKHKSAAEYQTLSSSTQLLGITVSDYTISTKQYLCVSVCLSLSMIP